jgi:hypothetical protein
MPSVTVNLDINVNAQTAVEVFGQTPTPPTQNIVIADIMLPVNVFYNNEFDCLIYFQGQGDNIVASKGNFTTTEEQISNAINLLINGVMDGYQAFPFNESQYYILPYTQYDNFGELALASYAHSLTGHVDATAAITNDDEITSLEMLKKFNIEKKIISNHMTSDEIFFLESNIDSVEIWTRTPDFEHSVTSIIKKI